MKASPRLLVAALLVAACGSSASSSLVGSTVPTSPRPSAAAPSSFPSVAPTPSAASTAPSAPAESAEGTIDGRFDVGGHRLYLRCVGTGSPTIVYLHGAITDARVVPHRNGRVFQDRLGDDYRVCVYDRRNLGNSDTIDEVQPPDAPVRELEALLAAAGVDPPYVLLGASFGGLLAYHYMSTHPDDVVGMVLLDSMIPNDLEIEPLYPPEERYEAFVANDECCTVERLAHFKVIQAASSYVGKEPEIPVIYLASSREPRDADRPELRAKFEGLRAAYLAAFSPGELEWVDAPHFMEPVIPDEIEAALRTVIALATQ